MEPAHSIRKLGFHRWYERRLLESFGWLIVCLLCAFVIGAVLEIVGLKTPGLTPLLTLAALYLVGLAGIKAWQRFAVVFAEAQRFANRSTCPECSSNGRFTVLSETARMRVQCRKCGHEWTIE